MQTKTWVNTLLALLCGSALESPGQESMRLTLRPSGAGFELSWPAAVSNADGTHVRPYFELQRSFDLTHWQPVGERQRAIANTPGQTINARITLEGLRYFYRLLIVEPLDVAKLGTGGAEVFGYGDAFAKELARLGQISPDQFAALFPSPTDYLSGISFDPTIAQFWPEFNADPGQANQGKQAGDPGFRDFDARLNAPELALFRKNGFVVSERLGDGSFGAVFYKLFHNDLPVFISCDALLQAWHRTYDAMLEETEETYLFNAAQTTLDGMAGQVAQTSATVGSGVLKDSLLDTDYFLSVARSLLAGTNGPPVPSVLGQDARVAATLADIRAEQIKEVPDFLGFCRVVDFSQFKVRGHYTHTERLSRYFQCLMWLGRIDIPVAGGPFERCPGDLRFASPRELGVAIVLWHLLNTSGQFNTWAEMERTITTFVGPTDSLNFGQLGGLLAGSGIRTLGDIPDLATLQRLQADLVSGQLGVQNIRSDWFEASLGGAAHYALPQTFTVFGQKFVPDSWAFSQTVFDSIQWVENGQTNSVQRRVPGALDVAFSVLANDQVVPDLVAQMKGVFDNTGRPHAQQFRDGFLYQHNLAAVRAVMDSQIPSAWESNLYMSWLACLQELSPPTVDAQYPEAMRTRAWAMKTLNTQLASWTQLRHDTILYAKQSYTGAGQCMYPKGFVEPRSAFWARLQDTATRAAGQLAALTPAGNYPLSVETDENGNLHTNWITMTEIQNRQVSHLQNFASVVDRLTGLARKELAQEAFTDDEQSFVTELMEIQEQNGIGSAHAIPRSLRPLSGGSLRFSGWYPQLFYRAIYWNEQGFDVVYGANANDAIVADVHTDVPSNPDPGSVLHEGIGHVNILLLAVNNGEDRFLCAGPVMSHYEFEVMDDPRRLSDGEWGGILDVTYPSDVPTSRLEGLAPPVWTRGYLVPSPRP